VLTLAAFKFAAVNCFGGGGGGGGGGGSGSSTSSSSSSSPELFAVAYTNYIKNYCTVSYYRVI